MREKIKSLNGEIPSDIHEKTGVSIASIYRHINGEPISPVIALKYHEAYGWSLSDMCPKIWRVSNESRSS